MRVAGALSYTTLLALVPLTTVAFAVLSVFPVFELWMTAIQEFIYSNFVPSSGEAVKAYLQQFVANADNLTFWGLMFLVVASLMVMATIERVFNDIWHVPQTRKRLHRYLSYWALLTLGPVFIGLSLTITSSLIALPVFSRSASLGGLQGFLLGTLPVLFEVLMFVLLYTVVPNYRVRLRHALVGSVFAATLFEIAKHIFTVFVVKFSSYKAIYGAIAVLPVFLIWIYLSWTVILLGAVVTAALPERGDASASQKAVRRKPRN